MNNARELVTKVCPSLNLANLNPTLMMALFQPQFYIPVIMLLVTPVFVKYKCFPYEMPPPQRINPLNFNMTFSLTPLQSVTIQLCPLLVKMSQLSLHFISIQLCFPHPSPGSTKYSMCCFAVLPSFNFCHSVMKLSILLPIPRPSDP